MKHIPGKVKSKYEILGIIGEGAYGLVLKARKKESNTIVAIKHFKQAPGYSSDADIIDRELKILQSLRFENVVELIEWFRDKKHCFLVFEYVEWNMLQVLQEHPQGLPLEQVRLLSFQLFRAIDWCHKHEIIHRDIKPENLLISKRFVLKLCDFGFARFCNAQASADCYTGYVATRWYRSPELLVGAPYGKPVDIWACGCMMAELKTGQALFAGESDIDQLYRIQKCLGPLPVKYMEAMRGNPSLRNIKSSHIQVSETLEQRFGQIFPTDMMNLFKNTLRLNDNDRLPADRCVEHEAYSSLNQKRLQRQQQTQQTRSKTAVTSIYASQPDVDRKIETVHSSISTGDTRFNKWYDENLDADIRQRSLKLSLHNVYDNNSTDVAYPVSSFTAQNSKYRSNTQLTDRLSPSYNHSNQNHQHHHHHRHHQRHHKHQHQHKISRTRSRVQSSSSDEQSLAKLLSPRSVNSTSDDDDENNADDISSILARKTSIINYHSTQSLAQQPTLISSRSKYIPNGVHLRTKQIQSQSTNLLQQSLKDSDKKLKRNHSEQPQINETNIYRSLINMMPTANNSTNGSSSFRQQREEFHNDFQQRPKTRELPRDITRSRTIDYHPLVETTSIHQRSPSRQNHHHIVSDPMDDLDIDSMAGSTIYHSSRLLEPQQNNRYSWNKEQQKSVYASDSHLINSKEHNLPYGRSFYSSNKTNVTTQRDPSYDGIKSAKLSSKQNIFYPKTSIESNRKQQSSNHLFDVYPLARTAISNVANILSSSSQQRQQSMRFLHSKSRQS